MSLKTKLVLIILSIILFLGCEKRTKVIIPTLSKGILINKTTQDIQDTLLNSGIHFISKQDSIIIYNVRFHDELLEINTFSKDSQIINLKVEYIHTPQINKLTSLYKEIGVDYNHYTLKPLVLAKTKDHIKRFNTNELIVLDMTSLSTTISKEIDSIADKKGIYFDSFKVSILNLPSNISSSINIDSVYDKLYSNQLTVIEFIKFLKEKKTKVIGIDPNKIPNNWVKKEDILELFKELNNNTECTLVINIYNDIALTNEFSTIEKEVLKLINIYFTKEYLTVNENNKTKKEIENWFFSNR